jgi:hypothetical protein
MTSLAPLPDATREHVAALELEVSAREAELAALKTGLRELHSRYLEDIGPLYAKLVPLDAAVAEAEIAAGLRSPAPDEAPGDDEASGDPVLAGCGPASAPSGDLKRMFRDIARAVHPDTGHPDIDERTRYRRHSLMAEANRASAPDSARLAARSRFRGVE